MKIDLAPALHLLRRCPAAVFATHSLHRPGFPCATSAIAAAGRLCCRQALGQNRR